MEMIHVFIVDILLLIRADDTALYIFTTMRMNFMATTIMDKDAQVIVSNFAKITKTIGRKSQSVSLNHEMSIKQ